LSELLIDKRLGTAIGLGATRDKWLDSALPLGAGYQTERLSLHATWNWARPLFAAYARDVQKGRATWPTTADLLVKELDTTRASAPLSSRHLGTNPLVLRRITLWIPYTIGSPDSFLSPEKWPNVVKSWTPEVGMFGSLLVVVPRDIGREVVSVKASITGGIRQVLPRESTRAIFLSATHEQLSTQHPAHARGSLVLLIRTWRVLEGQS
jgi:hypothetical protein